MGHWNDITSTRGKVRSSCGKRNVNFLGEERGRKEKKRKKNRKFQIARTEKKKKQTEFQSTIVYIFEFQRDNVFPSR